MRGRLPDPRMISRTICSNRRGSLAYSPKGGARILAQRRQQRCEVAEDRCRQGPYSGAPDHDEVMAHAIEGAHHGFGIAIVAHPHLALARGFFGDGLGLLEG